MADFLEERLPIDVRTGASYADEFAVEITTVRSGAENRRLIHPYPVRHFTVNYTLQTADLWARVVALYSRAFGMYAGFRVSCKDDFSTNNHVGTPTALDQPMALIAAGIYQLQKQYGAGGTPLAIGLPVRTLYKPVTGTVRVGVSGVEILNSPIVNWTVDTTTGIVTFSAGKTAAVSAAITKASAAVIPCAGHTFAIGEYVHITGVVGMTQINGRRALITARTAGVSITVAIDSTLFTTWTAGGTLSTRPQPGEVVTAGCQFDIPARFNSRIDIQHVALNLREAGSIDIVELVSP